MSPKKPNKGKKRTVAPAHDLIQRMRIERGWTVEDLAAKAHCSERTIRNAEQGKDVYIVTLRAIADALGLDFAKVLQGANIHPTDNAAQDMAILMASGGEQYGNPVRVFLVIAGDFKQFDETKELPRIKYQITKLVDAVDVIVKGVKAANSIQIELEMYQKDADALMRAFNSGKLDFLNVLSITLRGITVTAKEVRRRRKRRRLWLAAIVLLVAIIAILIPFALDYLFGDY